MHEKFHGSSEERKFPLNKKGIIDGVALGLALQKGYAFQHSGDQRHRESFKCLESRSAEAYATQGADALDRIHLWKGKRAWTLWEVGSGWRVEQVKEDGPEQ